MKFELKTYKVFKIKHYLKQNKLFFLYSATSLDLKSWLAIEQTLKKLNLSHYKLSNTLAIKTINASIYCNFKQLIHSLIMIVKPKPKTILKLKRLMGLEKVLTLLSVILNNKIYSILQLKNLDYLNYNQTVLRLFQVFIIYLTWAFKIAQKKNFEIM